MNKTKIILIALGGIAGLALLAFGWLIFSEVSAKSEKSDELESVQSALARYRGAKVFPNAAGERAVQSNAVVFSSWREDTRALAAAGDMRFEPTTPPAFKTAIVADARRIESLPGSAEGGHLVRKDFPFGFGDYVTGGMPPPADILPRLQREWYDIMTTVGILADCGACEIVDIALKAAEQPKAEKKVEKKRPLKKVSGKKGAKGKTAEAVDADAFDVTRLAVTFKAQASTLVKAMNAFAATNRFIVVEDVSLARGERDALAAALAVAIEGDAAGASPRRAASRGRGRRNKEKDDAAMPVRTGVVTDPAASDPAVVTLQLAIYDFRTKEEK